MNDDDIRHSTPEEVTTIADEQERARREASNSLRQARRVNELIWASVDGERPFKLRPHIIQELNRCAIEGLDVFAGNWRPGAVSITKSSHVPPEAFKVAEYVEELCDYVNDNWDKRSGVHLASFVMWRLNWIHPFNDGNGRTSRATSYLVLCIKEHVFLPGTKTIPERITEQHRKPYYEAIEAADSRYKEQGLTEDIVVEMEDLIGSLLAEQLAYLHKQATGQ